MWLMKTFDTFEEYYQLFTGAETVDNFREYTIKKKVRPLSIYYGVFDGDTLISYFWVVPFHSKHNLWHGFEFRVSEDYQGKGIGMFLYRYLVTIEKHRIVTDYSHSTSISHMWSKFCDMADMQVYIYNHLNDEMTAVDAIDEQIVYGNDYIHMVVGPK